MLNNRNTDIVSDVHLDRMRRHKASNGCKLKSMFEIVLLFSSNWKAHLGCEHVVLMPSTAVITEKYMKKFIRYKSVQSSLSSPLVHVLRFNPAKKSFKHEHRLKLSRISPLPHSDSDSTDIPISPMQAPLDS